MMVRELCVAELMIDLLDCLMAMDFRERAREEGEARMKYKRRGRWEGYSVWLALGNGPIMAGTHCPGLRKGLWREGERDFPACAVVSPCVAPLLTRGTYNTASTSSRPVCRSIPLHCSLNWVSSEVRRGNGLCMSPVK